MCECVREKKETNVCACERYINKYECECVCVCSRERERERERKGTNV